MLDGIFGEDEAHDRRRFDHLSFVLGEVVEACRQEVDRRRNDVIRRAVRGDPPITFALKSTVVDHHRHHLFDEQGIALSGTDAADDPLVEADRPRISSIIRPVSPSDSGASRIS